MISLFVDQDSYVARVVLVIGQKQTTMTKDLRNLILLSPGQGSKLFITVERICANIFCPLYGHAKIYKNQGTSVQSHSLH